MKCTCGHVMKVEGMDRNDAVAKMKAMMTQEELDKHMSQFHKSGEPTPTLEQSHIQIEQNLIEGDQQETPTVN